MDPTSVTDSLCRKMKPRGVNNLQIPEQYGIDGSMKDHHYGLAESPPFHVPKPSNIGNRQQDEAAEYYGVGCERGDQFYFSAFAGNGVRLNPVAEAACGAVVHGLCLRPIDSRRNAT
jgi:hypothetical protein